MYTEKVSTLFLLFFFSPAAPPYFLPLTVLAAGFSAYSVDGVFLDGI